MKTQLCRNHKMTSLWFLWLKCTVVGVVLCHVLVIRLGFHLCLSIPLLVLKHDAFSACDSAPSALVYLHQAKCCLWFCQICASLHHLFTSKQNLPYWCSWTVMTPSVCGRNRHGTRCLFLLFCFVLFLRWFITGNKWYHNRKRQKMLIRVG